MKIIETGHKPKFSSKKTQENLASDDSLSLDKNSSKSLEQAYLQLAQNTVLWETSLDLFMSEVCRIVSKTLDVGRVLIFKMDEEQSFLKTLCVYETTKSDFPMPKSIYKKDFPRYFSALENFGIIDADDARNDPRTNEFSDAYYDSVGISSILEACLYKSGHFSGVISTENLGGIRHWKESEKLFLNSVSNLISQRMLFDKINLKNEQQNELNAFHQAMINNSSYYVLTIDNQGKIKTFNKAITKMLGYEPQALLNQDLCGKIIPLEDMQGVASELSNELGFNIKPGFEVLFNKVSQGTSNNCENVFRTKEGKKIPVNVTVSALRTDTGEIKGYLCTANDISDEINTRHALHHEEQRYRFLFEGSNDSMFLMKNAYVVDCNQACLDLHQCSKEEFLGSNTLKSKEKENSDTSGLARIYQVKFTPEFQEDGRLSTTVMLEKYNTVVDNGGSIYFDWIGKRYDGTLFDAEVSFNKLDIEEITHVLVSVRDVSARKTSERKLVLSNSNIIKRNKNLALINNLSNELHAIHTVDEIYKTTLDVLTGLEHSPSVVIFTIDSDNQTMNLKVQNGIDEKIHEELVSKYQNIPINPDFDGVALKSGKVCYSIDIENDPRFSQKTKDDAKKLGYKTSVVIPVVHQGKPLAAIKIGYETTEVLDSEVLDVSSAISQTVSLALANAHNQSKLVYRAEHDSLTGLGNRDYYHKKFNEIMLEGAYTKAALFLLDLDRFKEVNDTLGHFTGDKVLNMISPRLKKAMSQNSSANGMLCRLGGDEFILMVYGDDSKAGVTKTAQSIIHCLNEPFNINELNLEIDASIGIAVYPKDGLDSHALLRSADVAMYQAKQEGTGFKIL